MSKKRNKIVDGSTVKVCQNASRFRGWIGIVHIPADHRGHLKEVAVSLIMDNRGLALGGGGHPHGYKLSELKLIECL